MLKKTQTAELLSKKTLSGKNGSQVLGQETVDSQESSEGSPMNGSLRWTQTINHHQPVSAKNSSHKLPDSSNYDKRKFNKRIKSFNEV